MMFSVQSHVPVLYPHLTPTIASFQVNNRSWTYFDANEKVLILWLHGNLLKNNN